MRREQAAVQGPPSKGRQMDRGDDNWLDAVGRGRKRTRLKQYSQ